MGQWQPTLGERGRYSADWLREPLRQADAKAESVYKPPAWLAAVHETWWLAMPPVFSGLFGLGAATMERHVQVIVRVACEIISFPVPSS